jgi:hypothetical protein
LLFLLPSLFLLPMVLLTFSPLTFAQWPSNSGAYFPRRFCCNVVLPCQGCSRVSGKGLGRVGPHHRSYEPNSAMGPAGSREGYGGAGAYMVAEAALILFAFGLQEISPPLQKSWF